MNQHKKNCQMSSTGWAASVPPECTCDAEVVSGSTPNQQKSKCPKRENQECSEDLYGYCCYCRRIMLIDESAQQKEEITRCQCEECKIKPHYSDCAVHNEPAEPNGECNCNQDTAEWEKEFDIEWKDKLEYAFNPKTSNTQRYTNAEHASLGINRPSGKQEDKEFSEKMYTKLKSFISSLILNTRMEIARDINNLGFSRLEVDGFHTDAISRARVENYFRKYGISLSDNQKM